MEKEPDPCQASCEGSAARFSVGTPPRGRVSTLRNSSVHRDEWKEWGGLTKGMSEDTAQAITGNP